MWRHREFVTCSFINLNLRRWDSYTRKSLPRGKCSIDVGAIYATFHMASLVNSSLPIYLQVLGTDVVGHHFHWIYMRYAKNGVVIFAYLETRISRLVSDDSIYKARMPVGLLSRLHSMECMTIQVEVEQGGYSYSTATVTVLSFLTVTSGKMMASEYF